MRYLFLVQVTFFVLYGFISGAAWKELYDIRAEQLKVQHSADITSLLIRLPIQDLGKIKTRKL